MVSIVTAHLLCHCPWKSSVVHPFGTLCCIGPSRRKTREQIKKHPEFELLEERWKPAGAGGRKGQRPDRLQQSLCRPGPPGFVIQVDFREACSSDN